MTIEQLEAERQKIAAEIEKLRIRKNKLTRQIYVERFKRDKGVSPESYYRKKRQQQ